MYFNSNSGMTFHLDQISVLRCRGIEGRPILEMMRIYVMIYACAVIHG